jgi:hypothetical protein
VLNKNVLNNEKSKEGLYQIHARGEIVDRDNTLCSLDLKILLKYRNANSRISLALSDPEVGRGVGGNRNEDDDDNSDKKSPPPVRQSIPITSLVPYEKGRANIGRANQNQIRRERASNLFRANKDSKSKERLTANTKEQDGINDAGENNKDRNDVNCQQREDEKIKNDQLSKKRRKPLKSARGLSRKRQFNRLRKLNYASLPISPVTRNRAARLYRRKKRSLSRSVFPDHYFN